MKWIFAIVVVAMVVLLVRRFRRQDKAGGEPAPLVYIGRDSAGTQGKDACDGEGAGSGCSTSDGGGDGGD